MIKQNKQKRPRPELVAPAGNYEKLLFAVKYGADAVYFGGEEFNLRTQAGNFTREEIEKSIALCASKNVKTLFLMNSFLHEGDLERAGRYISSLRDLRFHAIMVSDPGMILLLREAGVTAELHLSTQMNTLNHMAMKFWEKAGITRIVLGRETTLEEIRSIRDHTGMEIEIFVHGALCIAYSGRCLLSRYLSGRDANQGDCSQPCRWRYSLVEEKREGHHLDIIEHARGTEILSSMDLCTITKIPRFIEAGVSAFKIEGRMKSLYYTANTTRLYRHAMDTEDPEEFRRLLPFWLQELDLINHRPYTDDLFNEFRGMEFSGVPYVKKAMFLGHMTGRGERERQVRVRAYNPIRAGETVDGIFPIIQNTVRDGRFTVKKIFDTAGSPVEMARPGETLVMEFDREISDDAIFRRRTPEIPGKDEKQ